VHFSDEQALVTDSQKAARNLNIVLNGAQTQRPGSGPEKIKCLRRLARGCQEVCV